MQVEQGRTISIPVYDGAQVEYRGVEPIRVGKNLFLHQSVEDGWLAISTIEDGFHVFNGQGVAAMQWALDQLDVLPMFQPGVRLTRAEFASQRDRVERIKSLVDIAGALELPGYQAADLARGLAHQAYKLYSMACLIDPVAAEDVFGANDLYGDVTS